MKKRGKNIGKRLSIFTIVLALVAAILIVYVFNLWLGIMNNKSTEEYVAKTDKEKYEEVFYDNGWDRNIVAEIKEDIPIPQGFEYVSGTKETGFIIQDKANAQKMMWIPYDESVSIDNIDEYYANTEYDTIDYKSYKNMTKYGGFYILLSEINEYGLLKDIDQETYNNAKQVAENLYASNETVNTHLVYKTEIEQVLAYAKKIGINVEQTKNEEQTDIRIDKLIKTDLKDVSKVNNENINLSLVAMDMEINSNVAGESGFSLDNWYVYDVPQIITTPSGKELSVPVPVGFDVEKENNVVTITSQGKDNLSYVWIPVNEEFNTKDFSEEGLNQMTNNLKQAYGIADKTQEEILDYSKDPTETTEFKMLQKSVKKYGGFYMGQAELGFDNETKFNNQPRGLSYLTDSQTGEKTSYAKNGDYYRSVSAKTVKENATQNKAKYENSALEKDADGGYTLTYEKAKELTKEANKENVTAASNLVYGAQWNAALLWIMNSGNGYKIEQLVQNSEDLPGAKYEDTEWERETKSLEDINGLYGIAGNLSDITQETYSENNSSNTVKQMANTNMQNEEYHIGRGGNYGTTSQEKTVSGYQIVDDQTMENDSYGIRDCLILYVGYMDGDILEQDTTTTGSTTSNDYEVERTTYVHEGATYYTVDGVSMGLTGNGKAFLIADLIHSWLARSGHTYNKNIQKYIPDDSTKYTNGGHFVSQVLWEYEIKDTFRISRASKQFNEKDFKNMVNKGVDQYIRESYAVDALKKSKGDQLICGDIVLLDGEMVVYAGYGSNWYSASSNKYLNGKKLAPCNIGKSYWQYGIRLNGNCAYLSYDRMKELFLTYNSNAWWDIDDTLAYMHGNRGPDQTVLFTILSLYVDRCNIPTASKYLQPITICRYVGDDRLNTNSKKQY